ncbi:hypothetical protein [Gaopeijia maritima]|uniref:hypothetical protein n=1 Tax=Gaopeijia maritima TaxID=3119007 RepID=UPI00328161CC
MSGGRGVALIEVVVALLVVALGWMALLALHTVAVRIAVRTALDDEARWTLQALADSLDRHGGDAGERETPWGRIEWARADGGVLLTALDAGERVRARLWTSGGAP